MSSHKNKNPTHMQDLDTKWESPFHVCGHRFSVGVKVDMPNSVTYLNRTPIFEWYVDWCGSRNRCQKDNMYLQEIGLHAQKMITILSSTVNTIGRNLE